MSNTFSPPPLQRDFATVLNKGTPKERTVVDPVWAKWLQDLWTALNHLNSTSTTGTGATVLQNTPTLITPILGAATGTSLSLTGDISTGDATYLHKTTVALTNAAAGSLGTLANAPAAGNPTKWVTINDNGTPRSIPTW